MEIVIPKRDLSAPTPFLPIKAAATVTGLSQFYIRNGCRDGSIPHIKSGNQYYVNLPLLMERLNKASTKGDRDND